MNTKKFTLFASLFAIIVLIVGFSACDRVSEIVQPAIPPMTEVSEEISIGVVLPLTGRLADSFGAPMQEGFELALREINSTPSGVKLKFITEDDESTGDGAVAAFNKLIHEEKVSVILGPATSGQAEQVFPIAQENQVVAISATSSKSGINFDKDFVFRISLTSDKLLPIGIEVTQAALGYQKAATIHDEIDSFSIGGNTEVEEILEARGVKVVSQQTFKGGDTDFSKQLTEIKASNPEVIFLTSLAPEKAPMLIQGHALGITAPFIVRTLTSTNVEDAGVAAEGAMTFVGWGSAVDIPKNQAFVQNYRQTYNTEPTNFAARCYVALHVVAEAIANTPSTDATAIRDALTNIRDFDTIFGKFSFDANGDAVYSEKILIVKDGKLVPFE